MTTSVVGGPTPIGGLVRLGSDAPLDSSGPPEVAANNATVGCLTRSWGTKRVIHAGDSLMTGSNVWPGGSRIAFEQRVNLLGGNSVSIGPVVSIKQGFPVPYTPRCAGYPGTRLAFGASAYAGGGVIYSYLQSIGFAVDLNFVRWGTNDLFVAGITLAQMQSDALALFSNMDAVLPAATFKVVETLAQIITPAAPTIGLAAANALRIAFNAWLLLTIAQRGPSWSVVDTGALVQPADIDSSDGTHWLGSGHAKVGIGEAQEFSRIFPLTYGQPNLQPFLMRTKQASAKFTNKAADGIVFGVDDGWRLPAANFFLFWRWNPTNLANVLVTSILQSTPAGQPYTRGSLVAYDSGASTLNVYLNSLAAATFQTPIAAAAASLYWMGVHGDWSAGAASVWMGVPSSPTAPGAPYVVACVGCQVGFPRWVAGDANAVLTVGRTASFNAFAGAIDTIGMAQGTSVPGTDDMGPVMKKFVNQGILPDGLTAFARVDEGAGVTVNSAMGGAAGTLTGSWSAAGTLAWPSDQ